MTKSILTGILLIISCVYTSAQQLKLNLKKEIKIHSNSEAVDHMVYVQLPKSYGKLKTQFPVIVLLDAQDKTLYDYTSATIDRLMYTNDIPEAIFVGVVQSDRTRELSVERNEKSTMDFQHFLKTELHNYLKETYTISNYITFIGHSLGGQFLTNAMTIEPEYFRSVISVSGALNYPDTYTFYQRKVLNRLQNYLAANHTSAGFKQKYYFSAGDEGYQESGFKSGALSADTLFRKYPTSSLNWKFDFLSGSNHMTTPLQSIPAGLIFIFKDWHFSDSLAMEVLMKQSADPIETIRSQKEKIIKNYGTAMALPYSAYNQFIGYYTQKGDLIRARNLSQDLLDQYPDDEESHAQMADILSREGKKAEALRHYKLAQARSTPEKYQKEIAALMDVK